MKTVILTILIIISLTQFAAAQSQLLLPNFIEHQVIDIHLLKSIYHDLGNYKAEISTGIICWGTGIYYRSNSTDQEIYWTLDVVEGKINFVFNYQLEMADAKYFATVKKSPWQLRVENGETTIHFEVNEVLTKKGTIGDFKKIFEKSFKELSTLRFLKNLKLKSFFDEEKPKHDLHLKKTRWFQKAGLFILINSRNVDDNLACCF
ncbi:MAG: hypothetical protein ABIJ81_01550 [Patescibacteria group bacterium]